jgi:endonuclease VIII
MRTALVGKSMLAFSASGLVGPSPAVGRIVERISSHGKTLDIQWDDGITLRTQMRFGGSWHLYRAGERWRKSATQVRASIEVAQWVAVCFGAPAVETFRQFDRNRHPGSGGLGPDISGAHADLVDCSERMCSYRQPATPIAEVVLDERVMRGVGNVLRSELLWVTEFDPLAEVGDISFDDSRQIVNAAHRLVGTLIGNAPSTETGAQLNVYGRNGQRCGRCGDTIAVDRVGELNRLLYWCPGCQTAPGERTPINQFNLADPTPAHPNTDVFLADMRTRPAFRRPARFA